MQIIPIAGKGSRFKTMGYEKAKYLLQLEGKPILYHTLSFFNVDEKTLLILNRSDSNRGEVEAILNELTFTDFDIVEVGDTEGQLSTVIEGVSLSRFRDYKGAVWIFNGDTIRKLAIPYSLFEEFPGYEGFIEVFEEEGSHWSFTDTLGQVHTVVEKERISQFCSSGLYGFRSFGTVLQLMDEGRVTKTKQEYYISSVYTALLAQQKKVWSFLSPRNEFILCGTPQEYELAKSDRL